MHGRLADTVLPMSQGCSDNYCCFILLTEMLILFFFPIFKGSRGKVLNKTFQKIIIILETKPLCFRDSCFARGIKSNHCLQELWLSMF